MDTINPVNVYKMSNMYAETITQQWKKNTLPIRYSNENKKIRAEASFITVGKKNVCMRVD